MTSALPKSRGKNKTITDSKYWGSEIDFWVYRNMKRRKVNNIANSNPAGCRRDLCVSNNVRNISYPVT